MPQSVAIMPQQREKAGATYAMKMKYSWRHLFDIDPRKVLRNFCNRNAKKKPKATNERH